MSGVKHLGGDSRGSQSQQKADFCPFAPHFAGVPWHRPTRWPVPSQLRWCPLRTGLCHAADTRARCSPSSCPSPATSSPCPTSWPVTRTQHVSGTPQPPLVARPAPPHLMSSSLAKMMTALAWEVSRRRRMILSNSPGLGSRGILTD